MKNKIIPCFKSQYSIGKSILTLEEAGGTKDKDGKVREFYPKSIIDIALKHKINPVFLVEDSFSGFIEAYQNFKKAGLPFNFGLRMNVTDDIKIKNESSLDKRHKVIIFAKNTAGYKKLLMLSTLAATDGFYYEPAIDFNTIKQYWDNAELNLCIPFYDSFIFNNVMLGKSIVPDFSFTTPKLFVEYNCLPFDTIIKECVEKFSNGNYPVIKTKSIYYEKRSDFSSYMAFRCMQDRGTFNEPNMDHFSSNDFCVESYLEQNV